MCLLTRYGISSGLLIVAEHADTDKMIKINKTRDVIPWTETND